MATTTIVTYSEWNGDRFFFSLSRMARLCFSDVWNCAINRSRFVVVFFSYSASERRKENKAINKWAGDIRYVFPWIVIYRKNSDDNSNSNSNDRSSSIWKQKNNDQNEYVKTLVTSYTIMNIGLSSCHNVYNIKN